MHVFVLYVLVSQIMHRKKCAQIQVGFLFFFFHSGTVLMLLFWSTDRRIIGIAMIVLIEECWWCEQKGQVAAHLLPSCDNFGKLYVAKRFVVKRGLTDESIMSLFSFSYLA
jgi:hypothetical protein